MDGRRCRHCDKFFDMIQIFITIQNCAVLVREKSVLKNIVIVIRNLGGQALLQQTSIMR